MVYNESNLLALFSYFSLRAVRVHTDIIVSKTIPTITMKPTDQNGLSLSLSSLLTPIVPLLSLCLSRSLSPSARLLTLSLSLLSVCFYYRMCAQSLSTLFRLRINEWCEKKMDKEITRDIIRDFLISFFSFPSTYTSNSKKEVCLSKKSPHENEGGRGRACPAYKRLSLHFFSVVLFLRVFIRRNEHTGGENMNANNYCTEYRRTEKLIDCCTWSHRNTWERLIDGVCVYERERENERNRSMKEMRWWIDAKKKEEWMNKWKMKSNEDEEREEEEKITKGGFSLSDTIQY